MSPRKRRKPAVYKMTMSSVLLTPKKQGKNLSSGKKKKLRKGNCHPHGKSHFIKLKCSKCLMGFCSAALQKKFPWLKDPKTGWSCPCCMGACECKHCLTKKKRDSAELLSRVQRLTVERDVYKKQLAVERAGYEAYIADCASKLVEVEGSYSALEDHCSRLVHELVEERKENKQKVEKIRRLEEGLKQAEARAAAAESRMESELSSMQKI